MGRPATPSRADYEASAREYIESRATFHSIDTAATGTQRGVTLMSLAAVRAERPGLHVYNNCLVEYPKVGSPGEFGRVLPDNMVVVYDGVLTVTDRFRPHDQPAGPFLTMEYVCPDIRRKDHAEYMRRYEQDLRVPYHLLSDPHTGRLTLYRLNARHRYAEVPLSESGRYPIAELEVEVGLVGKWVRYWFRRELVLLPAEMRGRLTGHRGG